MHGIPFGRSGRESRVDYLSSSHFDIAVVGGGITGAGIAREASLGGLRVALLEAEDFASGTSSRSTKLFHGGLRYLERAEFLLVREGGREREGMQRLAPHLVDPLQFLLPVYRSMKYGKFAMGTAVWLYDRLAQVDPGEQRVMLTAREVCELEPGVGEEGLTGGVLYHEYLTDDARCVVTVLRAAEAFGAMGLNYAPVRGFLYEGGRVSGVRARDALSGREFSVRATVCVNAAGPWIEDLLAADGLESGHAGTAERGEPGEGTPDPGYGRVLHSRGVHLAFPRERLPVGRALALQTPDGRLLFVIPRGDRTYVGTTDEQYTGDLYHPDIPERDVEYLLDLVNGVFPKAAVGKEDIVGQWSGVRPLIFEPGKATKDVSRRDQIWVSRSGLVTVAGGKLTAWRKMAEDVMEAVYRSMGEGSSVPWLRERAKLLSPIAPLPGGATIPPKSMRQWAQAEAARLTALTGLSPEDAEALARRYGDEAELVALYGGGDGGRRIVPDVPLLRGELRYLVDREMAVRLSDVIVRRTGQGWFGAPGAIRGLRRIAEEMGVLCGWDEAARENEIEACMREAYWADRDLYASLGAGGFGLEPPGPGHGTIQP